MPKKISDVDRIVNFFITEAPADVRSALAVVQAIARSRGLDGNTAAAAVPAPATGKRRRGRPRKEQQLALPTEGITAAGSTSGEPAAEAAFPKKSRRRGRKPKNEPAPTESTQIESAVDAPPF
jgi:hypothetical protein